MYELSAAASKWFLPLFQTIKHGESVQFKAPIAGNRRMNSQYGEGVEPTVPTILAEPKRGDVPFQHS